MILSFVIIVLIILMLLGFYVTNLAYNYSRTMGIFQSDRGAAYQHSQAGIVDATERIRKNLAADIGGGPNGFNDPTFNPAPYHLDLDANPPTPSTAAARPNGYEVTVDIGPVNDDPARHVSGLVHDPSFPSGIRKIEVTTSLN